MVTKRYPLVFKKNLKPLTVGMELEIQVLDAGTLALTPRVTEILADIPSKRLTSEFFRSTLEYVSSPSSDVHGLEGEFRQLHQSLIDYGREHGLVFSSGGTHPLADYRDRLITPSFRYYRLLARNQWLIRRRAVYGFHIHLGMVSPDACIRFGNFFSHFIPHLIGLAASSPFWQKMETGLASSRSTIFESLPSAGLPYAAKTWKQFERIYAALMESKSIQSAKDISWDIRPSPRWGTLELRMCDATTLQEALAIAAWVHCLALWYMEKESSWLIQSSKSEAWMLRENKWRAIRFGLDAAILKNKRGALVDLRADIWRWLSKLDKYYKRLSYQKYREHLIEMLENGNSAIRQVKVFKATKRLEDVVKMQVAEFAAGGPRY